MPILPFLSHHSPRAQTKIPGWKWNLASPSPTPRRHLSSGDGGKFQCPHPYPRAHPTTTSLPVAEIGMGTTGFGIFFILLGVLLYFDSVLLAFGNVSAPAPWTTPNLPEVSIAGVNPSSFKSYPSSGQAPSSLGRQGGWRWTASPAGQRM